MKKETIKEMAVENGRLHAALSMFRAIMMDSTYRVIDESDANIILEVAGLDPLPEIEKDPTTAK